MLRAERLGLTHAGDVPSWEDLTRTRAECVVCTYLVATRKLPTTSTRHSSVPTQTRALRESTGATYRRWLRCGGMAAESPAPAMSCRHTDQMCCSDMLHIFRYRLVAAARMLTVRYSADTRTKHSTRKVSWTTSREKPAQGLCGCSTDAYRPILSRHTH